MKKVQLSEINFDTIKKVTFGNGQFISRMISKELGDTLDSKTVINLMWKTNTLQGDIIATKNNNHKIKIEL